MVDTKSLAQSIALLGLNSDKVKGKGHIVVPLAEVVHNIGELNLKRNSGDKTALIQRQHKRPLEFKFSERNRKLLTYFNSSIAFVERVLDSSYFIETLQADGVSLELFDERPSSSLLAACVATTAEANYSVFPKTAKMGKGHLDKRTLASIFPELTYDKDKYHEHCRLYENACVDSLNCTDLANFQAYEELVFGARRSFVMSSFFDSLIDH